MKLEALERRQFLSFSAASLSGTWPLVGSAGYGSVTWDGAGHITAGQHTDVADSSSDTLTGSYAVTPQGAATLTVYPTNGDGTSPQTDVATGALTADGTVLVLDSVPPGGTSTSDGALLVAVQPATSYAQSDLAGSWEVVRDQLRISFQISATGTITGTFVSKDNAQGSILSGSTAVLGSTGQINFTFNIPGQSTPATAIGFLNANKNAFSFITTDESDSGSGSDADVATGLGIRLASTATKANVFGNYTIAFQGGGGTVVFNGKGQITSGTVVSESGTFSVTGTYAISANDLVTGVINATSATKHNVYPFSGAISADDNLLAIDDTRFASSSSASTLSGVFLVNSVSQVPPTVSLSAVASSVRDTGAAQFTVTRTGGSTASDLTVTLGFAGTSKPGLDYSVANLPTTVVIPAGQTSVTVSVPTAYDPTLTTTRTLTAVVRPGALYTIGTTKPTTVTLLSDVPTVTIAAPDPVATRPVGTAPATDTITLTLSRADGYDGNDLPILLTYAGAKAGVDFAQLPGSVVIPEGEDQVSLTLTPLASTKAKKPQKVTVTLAKGAYILPSSKSVTLTLNPGT